MSKKSYGSKKIESQEAKKIEESVTEATKKEAEKEKKVEDLKEDTVKETTTSMSEKAVSNTGNSSGDGPAPVKKGMKIAIISGAIIMSLAMIALAVMVVMVYVFDFGNGEKTPEDAAIHYAKAISEASDKDIQSVIPRKLRSLGYGAELDQINRLAGWKKTVNASLTDVKVLTVTDVSDSIKALEKGVENVYGVTLEIEDAKYIDLSAIMSYNRKSDVDAEDSTESDMSSATEAEIDMQKNTKVYTSEINFPITVIKVKGKWYAYTASVEDIVIGDTPEEEETSSEDSSEQSTGEATSTETDATVVAKPPEIEIKSLDLDFYDGALEDLQAGKLTVESKEYTMPIVYKDFTDVLTIEEDIIDEESRPIKPNGLLVRVPCNYNNEEYAKAGLNICVGNATDTECDLLDGIVTTYYVGYPGQAFDYPSVYLPGNVTLLTSYDDVVKMYGELEEYTGSVNDKSYCKNMFITSDKIYCLKLNNVHNYIYFGFNADNQLIEIQYYYHDLNGFEDLTVKEEAEE